MTSESEEYITGDEDDVVSNSTGRSSRSTRRSGASNVTVDDTDSEDESFHPVQKRRANLAAALESESDEDEMDQRALSPMTRMSITGVRPQDLNSDSSEIDYSDEEQLSPPSRKSTASRRQSRAFELSVAEEVDETFENAAPHNSTDNNHNAPSTPRYTTQFINNIENTLHSTIVSSPKHHDDSSSSDILVLSNKETPIEISSTDSENSYNKENISAPPFVRKSTYSPRSSAGAPAVKASKNLVQPTIQTGFQRTGSLPAGPRRSRIKSEDGQLVSKQFYQTEASKLVELRSEMNEAQKLFDKVGHKLPDKGSQIKKKIESIRNEIEIKINYLNGLKVEVDNQVPEIKVSQPRVPNTRPSGNRISATESRKSAGDELGWDELSEAVNQIKPTHTGTQGLATFNTQKALTVDRLKDLHGSLKDCPAENVLAEDPQGLKVTLMDHQKHALAWMDWREGQKPRGGILADDMGLGKTLTMISAVLACKNRTKAGEGDESEESNSEDDSEPKHKGGWTSKGRKDVYKGGTLVVCPASLIGQWEGEVQTKLVRHKLTVCVHHGNNRESKAKHLRTYDIVVTTYNIVAREHKSSGALFGVKWRRIILDEAHVVRNHKAQSSMAVCELRGKYRWVLTGTPIQNKEMDVYALLKFLRCTPFDDLTTWKKWIDNKSAGGQQRLNMLMKSIMLRRTKAQLQIDGKLNSLPNKEIRLIEVALDTDEMNVYQKIMIYSRTLFAQFLFQRAEKDSDMNFINDANKPTNNQIKDPNGAYYKMHEKFSRMHHGSKEVKSHEILVLLLRLRQICCHPGLIDAMLEDEESCLARDDGSDQDCPEIDLLAQLNKLAITNDTTTSSRGSRGSGGHEESKISKASQNVLKRSNPVFNLRRPSTKMQKVMEILKKSVLPTGDKAIIVSQWTSVLDLLRDHLEEAKIKTLSLNGSIPVKFRQEIVNEFNNAQSSKRILLLSLTAGGVGLNLIGANHLLLIDLHWNPQLEAQAQDRIYRVGQKKDVIIYKFMCQDTVEQRIKQLQDHKLELANGVLTGTKISTKLSIDDLKGLFGL